MQQQDNKNQPGSNKPDDRSSNKNQPTAAGGGQGSPRTQGQQNLGQQTQGQQSQSTSSSRTGPDSGNARGNDLPSSGRDSQRDTSRGVQGGKDDLEDTDIDAAAPGHDIDPKDPKSSDKH